MANDKCSVFVPLIDISFDGLVKKDLSVEIQPIVKSKTNFAKKMTWEKLANSVLYVILYLLFSTKCRTNVVPLPSFKPL